MNSNIKHRLSDVIRQRLHEEAYKSHVRKMNEQYENTLFEQGEYLAPPTISPPMSPGGIYPVKPGQGGIAPNGLPYHPVYNPGGYHVLPPGTNPASKPFMPNQFPMPSAPIPGAPMWYDGPWWLFGYPTHGRPPGNL